VSDGIAGDQVKLDGMMILGNGGHAEFGVAAVQFADGTTWTGQQLVNLADTASISNQTLYGFQANGTFTYAAGNGQVEIREDAGWGTTSAAVLVLGAGIAAGTTFVTTDSSGNLYLTDGTAGDRVKIDGMATLGGGGTAEYGVAAVQFADGTVWTRQQMLTGTTGVAPGFTNLNGIYRVGDGTVTLPAVSGSTLKFGAGVTAANVTFQADSAGDLTILDGTPGDSITIQGDLSSQYWGILSAVTTISFNGVSTMTVGQPAYGQGQSLTFTWTGTAANTTLAGSAWGNNTFWMAAGVAAVGASAFTNTYQTVAGEGLLTLGGTSNVLVYNPGEGAITASANGGRATVKFGAGVTAANVTFQANSAGDLTILDGTPGDSITIQGDLSSQYWGILSDVTAISFNGVSTMTVGQPAYGQGQSLTFTWTGTTANTTLTGSSWGNNTFWMAAGVAAVGASAFTNTYQTVAGEGLITLGGSSNVLMYNPGEGAITAKANGGRATVNFGTGITAANVTFQANNAGDLTILDGTPGDSITIQGDLSSQYWGILSDVTTISFIDGSSMTVGQPAYGQGQSLTFTWTGTAANTTLTGSSWGNNVFALGAIPIGNDVIAGFNPANDIIQLSTTEASSFSAIQADLTNTSSGALVTFDANDSVLISGVAASSLHAANFRFV
jgi:hypothetical protein